MKMWKVYRQTDDHNRLSEKLTKLFSLDGIKVYNQTKFLSSVEWLHEIVFYRESIERTKYYLFDWKFRSGIHTLECTLLLSNIAPSVFKFQLILD